MPLLIPDWLRANDRHPILANVSHFYPFESVTGKKVTVADVVFEISSIPREDAIRWICVFSKIMLEPGGLSTEKHLELARQFFPSEWVVALNDIVKQEGNDAGAIFHRQSIWFVLQLIVVSCQDSSDEMSDDEVSKRIGRACFMANDIVDAIDAERQQELHEDDIIEWMVTAFLPMSGCDFTHIEHAVVGRAFALWNEAPGSPRFQEALKRHTLKSLETEFEIKYHISLKEFFQFLAALFVRFTVHQTKVSEKPLLLDSDSDPTCKAFSKETRQKCFSLISQTPEELAIRLLRTRQSWTTDVTAFREQPLLEVKPNNYCCPDMTVFIRVFIDRVYFLLQDAYPKAKFREIFGELFDCYLSFILEERLNSSGDARTWLKSPKFANSNDEAADAILHWYKSAAVMEYKAGKLSTRELHAGIPSELLNGIKKIAAKENKGVVQLAKNLKRMLNGEHVSIGDYTTEFSHVERFHPILVCFEEALGIHAVTKWLQSRFDESLENLELKDERIGPLIVLTYVDFEYLALAGKTIPLEEVLQAYSNHLRTQTKDYTGNFSRFLYYHYQKRIDWNDTMSTKRNMEVLNDLRCIFEKESLD